MSLLPEQLAEQKIREVEARGDIDDLPGAGKPLVLGDDRDVPESPRVGYRLLKNADFLPPAMHTLREIRDVEDLLANTDIDVSERRSLHKRLDVHTDMFMRLERQGAWHCHGGARAVSGKAFGCSG